MGIYLDREEHGYVVRKDSEILSRYVGSTLEYALKKAQEKAKAIREKLYVTKAAVSDWYVGVPFEGKPVIFYDTGLIFAASLPEKYRYLEGPFMDSEEAARACMKLTGELGEIQT